MKKILFVTNSFCARAFKEYLQLKDNHDIVVSYKNKKHDHYFKHVEKGKLHEFNNETINEINPDIIHVHNTPNELVGECFGHDRPIIFDVHDYRQEGFLKAIKLSDYIYTPHSNSRTARRLIDYGIGKWVFHIENAYFYESKKRKKLSSIDGKYHIGFIGSLYSKRTALYWIKKIRKISDRLNVHFHFHVNTSRINKIIKCREGEYLHIEPEIDFFQLGNVLSGYDAGIVIGGNSYALPNKFFDYINAEIPVIINDNHTVMKDYIEKYNVGISVRFLDITKNDIERVSEIKVNKEKIKNSVTSVNDVPPYGGIP